MKRFETFLRLFLVSCIICGFAAQLAADPPPKPRWSVKNTLPVKFATRFYLYPTPNSDYEIYLDVDLAPNTGRAERQIPVELGTTSSGQVVIKSLSFGAIYINGTYLVSGGSNISQGYDLGVVAGKHCYLRVDMKSDHIDITIQDH